MIQSWQAQVIERKHNFRYFIVLLDKRSWQTWQLYELKQDGQQDSCKKGKMCPLDTDVSTSKT